METVDQNTVNEQKPVAEQIDANAFGEVQKQMLAEKQKELDELNHSISNIEFSMKSLLKQLSDKRSVLEKRQAEFDKIHNMTLESLLNKKG